MLGSRKVANAVLPARTLIGAKVIIPTPGGVVESGFIKSFKDSYGIVQSASL